MKKYFIFLSLGFFLGASPVLSDDVSITLYSEYVSVDRPLKELKKRVTQELENKAVIIMGSAGLSSVTTGVVYVFKDEIISFFDRIITRFIRSSLGVSPPPGHVWRVDRDAFSRLLKVARSANGSLFGVFMYSEPLQPTGRAVSRHSGPWKIAQ